MTDYIEYTPKRHGQRPPYWTPDTETSVDGHRFIRQPNWAWIAGTVYYVPYEAVHGVPRLAMDELIAQDADLIDICAKCEAQAKTIEALQADKVKLREALKQIEASTYPRPLGKSWRMDLSSSKHDRCIHDEWMYDTCEGCLDDFIRKALQETER
jgi:hypothetical protein